MTWHRMPTTVCAVRLRDFILVVVSNVRVVVITIDHGLAVVPLCECGKAVAHMLFALGHTQGPRM